MLNVLLFQNQNANSLIQNINMKMCFHLFLKNIIFVYTFPKHEVVRGLKQTLPLNCQLTCMRCTPFFKYWTLTNE